MRDYMRALLEPHDGVPERVTKLEEELVPRVERLEAQVFAPKRRGARSDAPGREARADCPAAAPRKLCAVHRGVAARLRRHGAHALCRQQAVLVVVAASVPRARAERRCVRDASTILLDQQDTKAKIAAVTPAGKVPVLHDGDLVIWDSLAICEYVAELYPCAVAGRRKHARARARAISAEMHSGFAALRRDMSMDVLSRQAGQGHTPEALADAQRVQAIWRECLDRERRPVPVRRVHDRRRDVRAGGDAVPTYGVELDRACRAYVDAVLALPAMREWHCRRRARAQDARMSGDARIFQLSRQSRRRAEARRSQRRPCGGSASTATAMRIRRFTAAPSARCACTRSR